MKTILAILIFVLTSTAIAQKNLPKKPYTEWNEQQVMQLLHDSPWAQNFAQLSADERARNYPPGTNFFVLLRLYSALPVRQAIVRRMQLTVPYAKLTDVQRAKFDAELDGLLKCPYCADYYIVTLTSTKEDQFSTATRGESKTIDTVENVKRLPEDEIVRHVWLSNDKGERRDAARVMFTRKNEIIFLFRRLDEHGNALITPTNKKFSVEFDDYLSEKAQGGLKKFTFNVSDIVRNGDVLF